MGVATTSGRPPRGMARSPRRLVGIVAMAWSLAACGACGDLGGPVETMAASTVPDVSSEPTAGPSTLAATTAGPTTDAPTDSAPTDPVPTEVVPTVATESAQPDDDTSDDGGFDFTNLAGTTDGNIGGGEIFECEFREGYDGPTPAVGKDPGWLDFAPGSVRSICLVGFASGFLDEADAVDVQVTLVDPGGTTFGETVVAVTREFGHVQWTLGPDVAIGAWEVRATTIGDPGFDPIAAQSSLDVVEPSVPAVWLVPGGPVDGRHQFLVSGWPVGAQVAFGLYWYPLDGGFAPDGGLPSFELVEEVATITFGDNRADVVTVAMSGRDPGRYCLAGPGLEFPCAGQPYDMFVVP